MPIAESVRAVELNRRWEAAKRIFTPEAIADGHVMQARILRLVVAGTMRDLCLMCSRRAGKSRLVCGLLALTAMATDDCSSLYLALTKDQAAIIWSKHWLPMLKKFKIPHKSPRGRSTKMITTFPNGSTVVFGGTDDLRTVTHLLGDSMACGMCVLDEQQDDPGVLEQCAEVIFGPMLKEKTTKHPRKGTLVVSGTVPDIPVGYFYKIWSENYDDEKDEQRPDAYWNCFSWSRFDNPHELDNQEMLNEYLKQTKREPDDPLVLRAWYGLRVWGKQSTCFRYRTQSSNRWNGDNVRSIDAHSFSPFKYVIAKKSPDSRLDVGWVGIHPVHGNERFAITVYISCSFMDLGIWQVAEFVTDEGEDPFESEWIAPIKWAKRYYGRIAAARREHSPNEDTVDLVLRSHGILIESSIKGTGNTKAQVDRVADMLHTETLHVIEGSLLEKELIAAKWDPKERTKKKYEFSSACKTEVAKTACYILPTWTKVRSKEEKPRGLTEEQAAAEEAKRHFEDKFSKPISPKPRVSRVPSLYRRN